jgi:SNF2 family DNA or RNA helicase
MRGHSISGREDKTCSDCAGQIARQARRKSMVPGLPPSSAKTREVIRLLTEIREREGNEKTIIFSQFTSWLDIIEPFLNAEGIRYSRCESVMYVVCEELEY